jgi:hypothetical protein
MSGGDLKKDKYLLKQTYFQKAFRLLVDSAKSLEHRLKHKYCIVRKQTLIKVQGIFYLYKKEKHFLLSF